MVSRGDILELDIESSAYEGKAVAREKGLVVFVPLAVPGDRVRARVVRKKKKYAEAVVEEVLETSPDRAVPRCPHFGVCGGCTLQNTSYEAQLRHKRNQVADLMERIGGFTDLEIPPVLLSPDQYYYRNKMEFTFGNKRWVTREEIESGEKLDRDFALGLHIPGRFDRILNLDVCYLQRPETTTILNVTRDLAQSEGWEPYDTRHDRGYLRNLVIRTGTKTDQILVNLVTTRFDREDLQLFTDTLLKAVPGITTIVHSLNNTRSPVAAGEETVLHGPGYIEERLNDLFFQIFPTTFFQPNVRQAEILISVVQDFGALQPEHAVLDLYTGTGAIALSVSDTVDEVVGIENGPASVEAARKATELNQITNCRFLESDVREGLSDLPRLWKQPDVVIIDPPRSGMHPDVCKALNTELFPDTIIYTSCNPATQARDLKLLTERYQVVRMQPVDMFPQTYHIENVALLKAH